MSSSYADLRAEWQDAEPIRCEKGGIDYLDIMEQPVMQSWEAPLMAALVKIAAKEGTSFGGKDERLPLQQEEEDDDGERNQQDEQQEEIAQEIQPKKKSILEIGFGLGLSARLIDVFDDKFDFHLIIEANKSIANKAREEFCPCAMVPSRIICGFWQDVVETLPEESFDAILFDTYPLTKGELIDGECDSFFAAAYRLLRPGGVFTFYFDVVSSWLETKRVFRDVTSQQLKSIGFQFVGEEEIECRAPKDCMYFWKDRFIAPYAIK